MLTTITPYWGRDAMLQAWVAAIKGATVPGLKHMIIFVGEPVPDWLWKQHAMDPTFHFVPLVEDIPGLKSIGHYHNLGAKLCTTKWMMKMDVDTLPNVRYFVELLKVLEVAHEREWFNGGMIYMSQQATERFLQPGMMPLSTQIYKQVMSNLRSYSGNGAVIGPAATNFICRVEDYLSFKGCDDRFCGYGWEDYYQIYMLEKRFRGKDPLPGKLALENVTKRCCAEISRTKARALYQRSAWLCLLHRFHHASANKLYKSHEGMLRNKALLLQCIQRVRMNTYECV